MNTRRRSDMTQLKEVQMLKRPATVLVFLLVLCGIFLIGSACCETAVCSVCGTYVNQENQSDFLELKPDGTFYQEEAGISLYGTWEIEGNTITLRLEGLPFAVKVTIQGNTIIDPDGIPWVKQ
jgi:hypothetical protein